MENKIKKIVKYSGQAIFGENAKSVLVCEVRANKNTYTFPVLIDLNTGEMQGIDIALNKKYKDDLGFFYKKGVFSDETPSFIKVFPKDRIEKYKKKAQPIFSFRNVGLTVSQKNLLSLREKLGQKDGLLMRGSLLGTSSIDGSALSVPVYCDVEDEGSIKMFESFNQNTLITSAFENMEPRTLVLSSDEGMPILSAGVEASDGFLKMDEKSFSSIDNKIKEIQGIPIEEKEEAPKDTNEIFKYDNPKKEIVDKYKTLVSELSSVYEKYAVSESVFKEEHLPKGKEYSKSRIESIISGGRESPEATNVLFYKLRDLQKRFMYKAPALFEINDPIWSIDFQKEKKYTPKEIIFRNFSMWNLAYAKGDAEKSINFSTYKDYISFKKSFLHLQSLPNALPEKDFKINISFVTKNKYFTEDNENGGKRLTKQGKVYVDKMINSLKPALGKSLSWEEHEYDPSTDKFYYAEVILKGEDKKLSVSNTKEKRVYMSPSQIITKLERLLIEDTKVGEVTGEEVVKNIPSTLSEGDVVEKQEGLSVSP